MMDVSLSELMPIGRNGRSGPTERQKEAFKALREFDCLFYGGAGGGGKSFLLRWALLGLLLRWAGEGLKGVSVGLFSLDYPTLEDRQISKMSREFPPFLGKLKETRTDGLGFYLNDRYGGGILKLRNLDDPSKYRSSEFAAIAVEELPENELETFFDLFWRLRWPNIVRTKFLAAGNPEGVGLWWVKQLWIDKDFTGDLKCLDVDVPASSDRPAYKLVDQFAFVQALHSDNPNLDPSYESTKLATLPEMRRKAIRDGLWTVFKGQVFEEWRAEIHVCKPIDIPKWWRTWLCNDAGMAEPAAWFLLTASPDGQVYVIREWTFRDRVWHSDQARQVAADLKTMDRKPFPCITGIDSFQKKYENNKALIDFYTEGGIGGWDKPSEDTHPNRMHRAAVVHEYLKVTPCAPPSKRVIAKLQVFNTCRELIRTLPMLVADPNYPEEVKESAIDHWYDALSYGIIAWHTRRSVEPEKERFIPGTAGQLLSHAKKLGLDKPKKRIFS